MPQTAWLESVRLWQHSFMDRRAIDLFDDAPWPTEVPVNEPASPRPWLVASLVLAGLFLMSMALPWFTSPETPAWTPFSHWLDLGWSPGTQNWGFLVLALGAVTAIAICMALLTPRKALIVLALLVATSLVVAAFLEARASLSVNPGPNLHADYGAWIGTAVAVLALTCIAVSTYLGHNPGAGTVGHVGASYRP